MTIHVHSTPCAFQIDGSRNHDLLIAILFLMMYSILRVHWYMSRIRTIHRKIYQAAMSCVLGFLKLFSQIRLNFSSNLNFKWICIEFGKICLVLWLLRIRELVSKTDERHCALVLFNCYNYSKWTKKFKNTKNPNC